MSRTNTHGRPGVGRLALHRIEDLVDREQSLIIHVRRATAPTQAMGLRIGTSGWNYPSGTGTWNGLFYPATRSKTAGTQDFDELRFYAEHFDTVEVNSTFYGQPRAEVTRGWAARTPAGFEFSLKLYQKFTHPRMFQEAALKTAPGAEGPLLDLLAQVTQSDIDDFRAGIEPLATAGRARRAAGAVSCQLQGRAGRARLPRAAAAAPSATTRSPWSCGTAAGATPRRDAGAAQRLRRGLGADRRTEVPLLDPAELPAERHELLLHAAARPERRAVVAARQERGPLQLPVLGAASCRSSRTSPAPRRRW